MVQEVKAIVSNTGVIVSMASIGVIGYILHYWIAKKTLTGLTLPNGLIVGAAYPAFIGGLRVWLLCFDEQACSAAGVDWGYFFIAGVAAMWMAAQEVGGKHKSI